MSTQATAIIIPADQEQPIRRETIANDLTATQGIVGGWIEGLPSNVDEGWVAYGNEEAKLIGLPINERAHEALVTLGGHNPADMLRGNVVILGTTDEGEWVDVPEGLLEKFQAAAQ